MIGHCLSCQKRQQKRDAIGCTTKLVRLIMCPQLRTSVFWFQIKCCCCCMPVNDAAFKLLTVAYNETTVPPPVGNRVKNLRKTKQIIYHSKGTDKRYPKMYFFIEFEPLRQKLWVFLSNFGLFRMPVHHIW